MVIQSFGYLNHGEKYLMNSNNLKLHTINRNLNEKLI